MCVRCARFPTGAIPRRYFKEEYTEGFRKTVKELFLGEDRLLTKRYLRLFIERIVVNVPRVDIVGKTDVLLAVLENKTAVRTDGVLTAVGAWLPTTYTCKNYRSTVFLQQEQRVI